VSVDALGQVVQKGRTHDDAGDERRQDEGGA
jgi:hypothetical protein